MGDSLLDIAPLMASLPLFIKIAGIAALAGAVLSPLVYRKVQVRSALRKIENGEKFLARPGVLRELIRRLGVEAAAHFGAVEYLQRRLAQWNRAEDAQLLLQLPDFQGAFPVFTAALRKERIAEVFKAWLKENSSLLSVRTMALSAKGQDFDGRKARRLLDDVFDVVRELSGDHEWPVRFFSLRVLLADGDAQSSRLAAEAFFDSHPLLRRTAIREAVLAPDDLSEHLMAIALDDPVPEVRRCARERIDLAFPHRWKINPAKLNSLQFIHVLEQMKIGSREDENTAVTALKEKSPEACLAAARFLEKSGALKRLFEGANLGDMEDWDRRHALLFKSVSVGVTSFLSELRSARSVDVLLLGARLLRNGGDAELIVPLAEKAFAYWESKEAEPRELYREVLTLACARGSEKARTLVREELRKRRSRSDILAFILPILPLEEAPVFRDVLLEFLIDPDFSAEDEYLNIMARLPFSMFLAAVLDILEADRAEYRRRVRLRALRVLGAWRLNQTLQTIIENLPLLPVDHFRCFAEHFAAMDKKTLEERAAFILASPDAALRAAVISCLPAESIEALSADIREGLEDTSPDVRIACVRALSSAGGLLTTEEIVKILRDPVEKVRQETAEIAGRKATKNILKTLERLLNDTDESPAVRIAVLKGLTASTAKESVDIMVRFLGLGHDLRDELVAALAKKTSSKPLVRLVEHFKKSEAVLRSRITDVFAAMGEDIETVLIDMLRGIAPSLKPFLTDILTRTGFVEILIHRLGNRTARVRRDAAELLSEIGSASAYRGIVLAARDPDKTVRIHAVKALERLSGPGGEVMLRSLEDDPDKRVRHYTHWAMERLKAKKLP